MTTLTITDYLKYADLQMAAEAFIRDQKTGVLADSGKLLIDALVAGNNHASKFTQSQAEAFAAQWDVVDQCANTKTGFSGTLFRSKADPTQYVISFRSTEFIDDAARDNEATNALEIKDKGWAFGQIDDMQTWYQSLKDKGLIPAGSQLSVTGYSLGGHLATAFNLLYPGAAQQVVTFNGAGVGKLTQGDVMKGGLNDVMAYFHTLRNSPDAIDAEIGDAALRSKIDTIRSKLADGSWTVADAKANLAAFVSTSSDGGPITPDQLLVSSALDRMQTVLDEAARAPGLPSGSSDPALAHPADVATSDIAQAQFDYQMAVMLTGRRTKAVGLVDNTIQTFFGRKFAPYRLANQYDVMGDTSPSAVSNSQLHYGNDIRTFIEDQPLKRGSIVLDAVKQSLLYWDVKLLVPNYTQNDFGDTHSLVLLVDSLSVHAVAANDNQWRQVA